MSISFSGSSLLNGQGIDVTSTVSQLIAVERAPEQVWQNQESTYQQQASAYDQLNVLASTLKDSVNSLKDGIGGALAHYTATTSSASIVTASTGLGATIGTHSIVVGAIASTSSWYAATPVATSGTTLAAGSFDIQVGAGTATTITIDNSNNTLDQLAQSINDKNLGVKASVISDANGARLALVSNNSGASSNIAITNDTSGLGLTKAADGANASITIDGVPVESESNTVSGAVPGVTFTLGQAAPNTTVQISVGADTTNAAQAISSFVDAYNALISNINSQFQYNATTQVGGPLAGDSSTRAVQQQLLEDMGFSMSDPNSGYSTLMSLGISMNNDGTLTVDSAALNSAISSNYSAVQNLFQSANGFGANLAAHLSTLTDSTQGAFTVALTGVNSSIQTLQDQVSNFEIYITNKQQQLTDQYNKINVILQQLPYQLESIKAQVGSLLPSSNNSSS